MNTLIAISAVCFLSLVSAFPTHNGMVFYQMPYYNPYHQAMLVHYSPHSAGRSSGTSAFAAGDAVAAGTVVKENRFEADGSRATEQQASSNDGNVEAIAEAYPEDPQGSVQLDQAEEQYNEVIPLNVVPAPAPAPVSEQPKDTNEIPTPEREITAVVTEEVVPTTTVAPKKKVHIALDIPNNTNAHDETESDEEDDAYPYGPQNSGKPSKNGASPMYTFFPVSFGRAAGGTIAVANAYSTGKGAVRSHAIAYGTNGASRARHIERHVAAQKTA